jgi:hypothetical protein
MKAAEIILALEIVVLLAIATVLLIHSFGPRALRGRLTKWHHKLLEWIDSHKYRST